MRIFDFRSGWRAVAILIFVFNTVPATTLAQETLSPKEIEKQQKIAAKARKEQEKRERAEREKAERAMLEEQRTKILKIEDDEFSSDRKVTLLPQSVGPNLTISLEYKRPKHRELTMGEALTEYCTVKFVNSSGTWEYEDDANEFNFMVDGQRMQGGRASSNIMSKAYGNKNEDVVGVVYVSNLKKVAAGKEVKMKMGQNVFTLDDNLLSAIKMFVAEISK